MKKQIKPIESCSAFASARTYIQSLIIGVSLVGAAGAFAQTLRPAGSLVLSDLGLPGLPQPTNLFLNFIHAYTPADICAAYGVDALHAEGWTGKGQTIVIVDNPYGSATALQDLQTFSSTFGLSAPDLTIVHQDGQPALPNDPNKLGSITETSLDLQWAHAIAPDAKLVLVAFNPTETEGVQGFPSMFKGIQYAISNYPGSPISQSFAATEQSFSGASTLRTADLIQMGKYEAIYQQAIAAGCTPLAAAGDWGTANPVKQGSQFGAGAKSSDVYPYPTVSWPASSPSVTAVGGTWLQYHWRWDPQATFAAVLALGDPHPFLHGQPLAFAWMNWDVTSDQTEAVWREDWWFFGSGVGLADATGGGLSAVFPAPSWQTNLPASLTQGARALPDVSWNAARDGGVLVLCTPTGGWDSASGTSCGTPQIAGLVAIANQMRASMGKGPIGHLAPKLYQLPAADFNDIVPQTFGSGTNAVTVGDNFRYGSTVPGLPCTAGYDLTTGLGSPKAYNLVHDLASMFP
jgi:subtilase family serine protease